MTPALVMLAEPWAMKNKETGEIEREGATLTYFDLESPFTGNKRGYEPLRVSVSKEILEAEMGAVPAFYSLQFRQRANRETGKAELQCTGMRHIGPWSPPGGVETPSSSYAPALG